MTLAGITAARSGVCAALIKVRVACSVAWRTQCTSRERSAVGNYFAVLLREQMKGSVLGLGTDKKEITRILTQGCTIPRERKDCADAYLLDYGKKLDSSLKVGARARAHPHTNSRTVPCLHTNSRTVP